MGRNIITRFSYPETRNRCSNSKIDLRNNTSPPIVQAVRNTKTALQFVTIQQLFVSFRALYEI